LPGNGQTSSFFDERLHAGTARKQLQNSKRLATDDP